MRQNEKILFVWITSFRKILCLNTEDHRSACVHYGVIDTKRNEDICTSPNFSRLKKLTYFFKMEYVTNFQRFAFFKYGASAALQNIFFVITSRLLKKLGDEGTISSTAWLLNASYQASLSYSIADIVRIIKRYAPAPAKNTT